MNACQLRSLNVPPGTDQERRTIIGDELAEDWAALQKAMEFDFWETEPTRGDKNTDGFNVSVVATTRLWISQLWRDCRRSGLDCWAIDGLPLAMARSVGLAGGLAGGRRALAVDWGYSNTTFCIAGEDRPLYSRRAHDCSFSRVLDAVVNRFDVTLDEAQYLIENEGVRSGEMESGRDWQTADAITAAASGTVDELVRQIQRTLQFTEMQRRHLQPAAVWLMGGGASMKNIGPYLANALSLPVQIWSLPVEEPIPCAAGNRSAVFSNAAALSALAWRAA
jgi:Tfp pilus assembly PilM family ATPase